MTNAEWIRAMSDAELAKFLCRIQDGGNCSECPAWDCCHHNHNGMPDWLKQEHKEDDE